MLLIPADTPRERPPTVTALLVRLCPRAELHPPHMQVRRRGRDLAWWCDACQSVVQPRVERVFLADEVRALVVAGKAAYLVHATDALDEQDRSRDPEEEPTDLRLGG